MARPKKRVSSARKRWARTGRLGTVKERMRDRIQVSLRKGLCRHHFLLLNIDDNFKEEQERVCSMISISGEGFELRVNGYFPLDGVTLEKTGNFKAWLWSEMGERIREDCSPWCEYLERQLSNCSKCRRIEPTVIDLDPEEKPVPSNLDL